MTTFPIQTHDQKAVFGVALSFSILAVTAVSLRLISHSIAHKKWTTSDYFIIAACVFAVALQSVSITGVFHGGIGYGHVTDIVLQYGPEPITTLLQLIIALQFLWVLSLSCTKLSILFLYLRIFPYTWLEWSSYATMAVIFAWTIATILAGCFVCRPFAYNWDKTIVGGSCGDQVTSFTITGIINLLTDAMVLGLPMYPLYHLHMETYKKCALIAVFGLGIVTCIVSALRVSVLSSMDFTDITFTVPKANMFSGLEPCLAIVLASIPLMRPLLPRSTATPFPSPKVANSGSKSTKSTAPKVSGEGFKRLNENTNNIWLRPLGLQHRADISALQETVPRDTRNSSQESLHAPEGEAVNNNEGITVKQTFQVS